MSFPADSFPSLEELNEDEEQELVLILTFYVPLNSCGHIETGPLAFLAVMSSEFSGGQFSESGRIERG